MHLHSEEKKIQKIFLSLQTQYNKHVFAVSKKSITKESMIPQDTMYCVAQS